MLDDAGVEPDYVAVADLDGPTLAIAARVGETRLIDNVPHRGRRHPMTTRPRKGSRPERPPPASSPLPELAEMKRRGDRIVMITAYDAPSARIADAAGVDLILVGDSAAMVVLGHDSTVPATMDEMLMLTRAVTRGAQRPLVIADLPFGSYQVSDEQALETAIRFVKEAQRRRGQARGRRPDARRACARSPTPAFR